MENGGKKKKLLVLVILIFTIIAIVVGYQVVKKQELENLRNTMEATMQAFMEKDLSQALLHTDLKEQADNYGEYVKGYFYDYLKGDMGGSLMVTIMDYSDKWGDFFDVTLNVIRAYEIEEIAVENDNATIKMELTVADLSQVKLEGDMSEIEAVLRSVVSANSIFTDILKKPTVGTVLGGVEEYVASMIDESFALMNHKVIEADDKIVSIMLHAHKEDDAWIIEVADELEKFLQN